MSYSDEFKAAVLSTYKTEGQAAAVREHGIAGSTVARWARAAGITTDSATKSATEEAGRALERKRAILRQELIDRAVLVVRRIDDGTEARECQALATTVGILIDKLRLEAGEATQRSEVKVTDADRQRVAEDVARTIAEAERIARDAAP